MNHNEVRKYIEKVADNFDGIVSIFSGEKYYEEARLQYEKTRKICKVIKIAVFAICIVVIVMHVWGI